MNFMEIGNLENRARLDSISEEETSANFLDKRKKNQEIKKYSNG